MNKRHKTVSILTLGCRVNQYESDYIMQTLAEKGYETVPFGTQSDVTVVNTCTVTAESDRKSRQMIRRAVAASPEGKIIVTGCYAETGTDTIRTIEGITYITGNAKKSDIPDAIDKLLNGLDVESTIYEIDEAEFDPMMLTSPERTRSYIKIEDGCDNRCSYCIIPSARGKVRSKPLTDILTEAKSLYDAGCREVILTGIETAAYGRDFEREPYYGYSLAGVIEEVEAIGFRRIGLGSLEPTVMRGEFAERIAKSKSLMPHFHLSVQSGSTGVLNRMRRRYNGKMLEESVERLKMCVPDVTLSADIIVGFPGETDEEFLETVDFVKRTRFLHLHIFPYSIREGTEAAVMKDQITGPVKSDRLKKLSDIQADIKRELLEEYVKVHDSLPVSVLVEKVTDGVAEGHSEHFVEVKFSGDSVMVGKPYDVVLESSDGDVCFGKCISTD